jgi:hypothetical protein
MEYRRDANDLKTRLYGYCDTDFAGDKSKRKSALGNVYFFAEEVVLCSFKRQQTVAQSITKAEY